VQTRKIRSLRGDCRGSALVEGAVLMPLLFTLLFGVYDFSWLFFQQHLISTGVRDAARYLARSPNGCDAASALWDAEEAAARRLAVTGAINGIAPRVKGWTAAMVSIGCTPIDNAVAPDGLRTYRGADVIHVVTVSTRFADPSLGFFRFLGLQSPSISGTHSERVIGPG